MRFRRYVYSNISQGLLYIASCVSESRLSAGNPIYKRAHILSTIRNARTCIPLPNGHCLMCKEIFSDPIRQSWKVVAVSWFFA